MGEYMKSKFVAVVLLSEPTWDNSKFINELKFWNLKLSENSIRNMIIQETSVSTTQVVIDNSLKILNQDDIEEGATLNYLWENAVSEVQKQKAQICINLFGADEDDDYIAQGLIFSKVMYSILKSDNIIGIFQEGVVFEPNFYKECLNVIKSNDLPIFTWIWFAAYTNETIRGLYTIGFKKFYKPEIEMYVPIESNIDFMELYEYITSIASYILTKNITLQNDEIIEFYENKKHKHKITYSKGIALNEITLRVELS